MRRFDVQLRAGLALGAALSGVACGEGGRGDSVPRTDASVAGDGQRLATLNDPRTPRPSPDRDQVVTGVSLVALDAFDETHDGSSAGNLYVQDLGAAGKPYSGITVFGASYSPPALRVAPGDVLDLRGRYQEFPGPSSFAFPAGETLPELVGATVSMRFEGSVPAPVDITVAELTTYGAGRKWLGVLVRLTDVQLFADGSADSSGRWSARINPPAGTTSIPSISNALFDVPATGKAFTKGVRLKFVIGVVQYFQTFSLAPRFAEDLGE